RADGRVRFAYPPYGEAVALQRRVRFAYPPYGEAVALQRRVRFAYPPYELETGFCRAGKRCAPAVRH
ncbi:hypothetical protein, partial [Cronobacter sakazakii]|uniref:hypothetical protein n=1 Tax=Cronobacter sakazakii TaxID=28141 RepID=UPI000D4FFC62